MFEEDVIFNVDERIAPALTEANPGQIFDGMIGFKVIEKTKSFMILSINSFTVDVSRRIL